MIFTSTFIHRGVDDIHKHFYSYIVQIIVQSQIFILLAAAVQQYGLLQSYLGEGNLDIWQYMAKQHGSCSAVITRSSTHNVRTKRMWQAEFLCYPHYFMMHSTS